jgi:hypothetical protein
MLDAASWQHVSLAAVTALQPRRGTAVKRMSFPVHLQDMLQHTIPFLGYVYLAVCASNCATTPTGRCVVMSSSARLCSQRHEGAKS